MPTSGVLGTGSYWRSLSIICAGSKVSYMYKQPGVYRSANRYTPGFISREQAEINDDISVYSQVGNQILHQIQS